MEFGQAQLKRCLRQHAALRVDTRHQCAADVLPEGKNTADMNKKEKDEENDSIYYYAVVTLRPTTQACWYSLPSLTIGRNEIYSESIETIVSRFYAQRDFSSSFNGKRN